MIDIIFNYQFRRFEINIFKLIGVQLLANSFFFSFMQWSKRPKLLIFRLWFYVELLQKMKERDMVNSQDNPFITLCILFAPGDRSIWILPLLLILSVRKEKWLTDVLTLNLKPAKSHNCFIKVLLKNALKAFALPLLSLMVLPLSAKHGIAFLKFNYLNIYFS